MWQGPEWVWLVLLASDVDGVVITVQHAFHYEVARDALDAGAEIIDGFTHDEQVAMFSKNAEELYRI